MAGASMKDIKLRIRSVESTKQITSAMQLVAGSKLRRARQRMEDTRPYMNAAREVIADIAAHKDVISPFFRKQESAARCVVVIAGDRGLAGHYNAAVFNLADGLIGDDTQVLPIGKKAVDRYARRGAKLVSDVYLKVERVSSYDCRNMAERLIECFLHGDYGEVTLVATTFESAMTQTAFTTTLLPVTPAEFEPSEKPRTQLLMEPGPAALLNAVMPDYLAGVLYGAACDAVACEMAARRNAMDSATKNAEQMISDLSLSYNRARQGSITQEITEIVAGAEQ
ncbi:MAG: ATP synthase F1 subunit gamma [Clostridia bacterium]|nr:ATP synthase F1 subunit gamma [Clostridia bacterium]